MSTPRTGPEAVTRARSQLGLGARYRLGMGGRDPSLAFAHDPITHDCDCSGFGAWVCGVDRYMPGVPLYKRWNGGWFESSALVADFDRPQGIAVGVAWEAARPGMIVAWGDYKDATGKRRQGHVGTVTVVDAAGPTHVIHCSIGNQRAFGHAIAETPAKLFAARKNLSRTRGGSVVLRVAWIS